MKTTMVQAEGERRTMAKSGGPAQRKNRGGVRIQDNRPESLAMQRFAGVMNSQGQECVQQQPEEEEELLQGKLAGQRAVDEEDELLQGRFDPRPGPDRVRSS